MHLKYPPHVHSYGPMSPCEAIVSAADIIALENDGISRIGACRNLVAKHRRMTAWVVASTPALGTMGAAIVSEYGYVTEINALAVRQDVRRERVGTEIVKYIAQNALKSGHPLVSMQSVVPEFTDSLGFSSVGLGEFASVNATTILTIIHAGR